MSEPPTPHHTVELENISRGREGSIDKRENGVNDKDIELTGSSSIREVRDGVNVPLSGIPSPTIRPLGEINQFNDMNSFHTLQKDRTFDYNDDCPVKIESSTVSFQINNDGRGGDEREYVNGDLMNHDNENDNVSSPDKQYRNFNFKI